MILLARLLPGLALTTLLASCAGDLNPVRDAATAVGAGAPQRQAPDFIAQSRPARADYIPVGTAAPSRQAGAKTPDQVKAAEADLDKKRAASEREGNVARQLGATPAPAPRAP